MPRLRTLNELAQLQESGFGQPSPPHHGLRLLYWFSKKCVYFDEYNEMCWRFDPDRRLYGFHPFENRYDQNVQLLPDSDFRYYEVGNLAKPRAHQLPKYVLRDYTGFHDHSNTDRIIVSVHDYCFYRVYVTEHRGESDYNRDATCRISKGLLKRIRKFSTIHDFLDEMGG